LMVTNGLMLQTRLWPANKLCHMARCMMMRPRLNSARIIASFVSVYLWLHNFYYYSHKRNIVAIFARSLGVGVQRLFGLVLKDSSVAQTGITGWRVVEAIRNNRWRAGSIGKAK
jgi:hypothetical protein